RRRAQLSASGLGGNRTHNTLIKSQVLCLIELQGLPHSRSQCVGQDSNLHSLPAPSLQAGGLTRCTPTQTETMVGFEPTSGDRPSVLQTDAINRSATSS